MRKIMVFLIMALVVVLIAMALTKPDNNAHYSLVKTMVRKEVSSQLSNNKQAKELGGQVLYEAMGKANDYVDRHMHVRDCVFFTLGLVRHQGFSVPITLGVFDKVFFIGDEDEVKKAVVKKIPQTINEQR